MTKMVRRPWRELWSLGLGLGLMLMWELTIQKYVGFLVCGLAVLGFGYHFWLRRTARRKLVSGSDLEFVNACHVPAAQQEAAITLRMKIGKAFGLPADRVAADAHFRELMLLTGWFGSDLLALDDVQRAADAISNERQEVRPDTTVGEVVARAVSGSARS